MRGEGVRNEVRKSIFTLFTQSVINQFSSFLIFSMEDDPDGNGEFVVVKGRRGAPRKAKGPAHKGTDVQHVDPRSALAFATLLPLVST